MGSRRILLVAFVVGAIAFVAVPRILDTLGDRGLRPAASEAHRTAAELYEFHFRDARHERMFLASIAFFVTFGLTRAITHAIRVGRGPFHDVETAGGGHVHHLVWGILLLLGVGYLWLIDVGTGGAAGRWASPLTAVLFGVGAALTLDEFALWLTFRDVYWAQEGRLSVDAVLLFGSLLSIGLWGGPFIADLLRLSSGAFAGG